MGFQFGDDLATLSVNGTVVPPGFVNTEHVAPPGPAVRVIE